MNSKEETRKQSLREDLIHLLFIFDRERGINRNIKFHELKKHHKEYYQDLDLYAERLLYQVEKRIDEKIENVPFGMFCDDSTAKEASPKRSQRNAKSKMTRQNCSIKSCNQSLDENNRYFIKIENQRSKIYVCATCAIKYAGIYYTKDSFLLGLSKLEFEDEFIESIGE